MGSTHAADEHFSWEIPTTTTPGDNYKIRIHIPSYADYSDNDFTITPIDYSNLDWLIVGTGDFNGDNKTDILWRNKNNGQNALWLMDGTIRSSTQFLTDVADPDWKIKGTGDFNNDGHTDILWRNTGNGQIALWLMDGTTRTSTQFLLTPNAPTRKPAPAKK
ncbi:MAG: VCBS repeat-containing protein [bacterium]|nr:VCBS repeat-containing protein [bacterium]